MSLTDGLMSYLTGSVPSLSAPPLEPTRPEVPAEPPAPAATGCALEGVATALFVGDLHGDGERARLAFKHAERCLAAATENRNALHAVFLGNTVPCHHASKTDATKLVLSYARGDRGVNIDTRFRAEHVHVLLGDKDVGLLRFLRRGRAGELALVDRDADGVPTRADVAATRAALLRPSLVAGAAEVRAYEASIEAAFAPITGLVLPAPSTGEGEGEGEGDAATLAAVATALDVLMLLKLEAMAATSYVGAFVTTGSPGLVRAVVRHAEKSSAALGPCAAYLNDEPLRCPLNDVTWLAAARTACFSSLGPGAPQLSERGRAVARFARPVLQTFFDYLDARVLALYDVGKLVDLLTATPDAAASTAVWAMHSGTSDGALGSIVGRAPTRASFAHEQLRVEWAPPGGAAPMEPQAWADDLNGRWRTFTTALRAGAASDEELRLWVALSMPSTGSGPLCSASALVLHGLGDPGATPPRAASGVVAKPALPFGCTQRAFRTTLDARDGTMQRFVTSTWTHLGTDAFSPNLFWSVGSFCPSTAAAAFPAIEAVYRLMNGEMAVAQAQAQVTATLAGVLRAQIDGVCVYDRQCPDDTGCVEHEMPHDGLVGMRAVIGPIVAKDDHRGDLLRATYWYSPLPPGGGQPPPLLMLFPEHWISNVLSEYRTKSTQRHTTACVGMVEGVLVLRTADRLDPWIPMEGTTRVEADLARDELGPRAWVLRPRDPARLELARRFYAGELADGAPALEADVFRTTMPAEDFFSGLVVRLVPSADRQPLLEVDSDAGGAQGTLEQFVKR